jgi:glycolate oxidase
MTCFQTVSRATVVELKQIVGARNVLYGDADQLEPYAHDESGGLLAASPDVVVKPETTEQVSAVMRLASREGLAVTPRGAGSGLAGGAVPVHGGIVLSLERMNRIIEIDQANLTALVEPGVVTNDLCRAVAELGLLYAGYPMSVESSSIGGNVACNAGGAKVVKYGSTAAHVLGLEVVLASGEVLRLGGKRKKDASGYNLTRLFVGSEGTLGIITQVTLNLVPAQGQLADLLVPFAHMEDAVGAVPRLVIAGRALPVAVEFLDRLSVKYSSAYVNWILPRQAEAEAYLIVQLDGKTREDLQEVYEVVGKTCIDSGALEVFVADNRFASEKIWSLRRNYLEALKAVDPLVCTGDVVVPVSEIPTLMQRIKEVSAKHGVEIPCAGHAADGNIHPAPLRPDTIPPDEWRGRAEEILEEIAIAATALGGAVSGEHGIGVLKKKVLEQSKPREIEIMRAIKSCLDPRGLLNPGKLF